MLEAIRQVGQVCSPRLAFRLSDFSVVYLFICHSPTRAYLEFQGPINMFGLLGGPSCSMVGQFLLVFLPAHRDGFLVEVFLLGNGEYHGLVFWRKL